MAVYDRYAVVIDAAGCTVPLQVESLEPNGVILSGSKEPSAALLSRVGLVPGDRMGEDASMSVNVVPFLGNRWSGPFQIRFSPPEPISTTPVAVTYSSGIYIVTCPKASTGYV